MGLNETWYRRQRRLMMFLCLGNRHAYGRLEVTRIINLGTR